MLLSQLSTPALVLDGEKFRKNLKTMSALLAGSDVSLRPHYKSNKCSAIAHMQIESGAKGMTCAKISEAEDLITSGISDVLIANQIVDGSKIRRAAELALMCRLTVCADSAENLKELSEAAVRVGSVIHVLIEFDIGMCRCGVTEPEAFVRLAELARSLPGLEFDGIQAYAGHASHVIDGKERLACAEKSLAALNALREKLAEENIPVGTISGGSTGTSLIVSKLNGIYTELQAGSYIFMDSTYEKLGLPFENSLFVISTVVSARPGLTVLDVGAKGLGADQDEPFCITPDGRRIAADSVELNEEHLKLFGEIGLKVGDRVLVVPGHCCTTVNLYDLIYVYEGEKIVDRFAVTARGKSV